jgi:hypothetical protein
VIDLGLLDEVVQPLERRLGLARVADQHRRAQVDVVLLGPQRSTSVAHDLLGVAAAHALQDVGVDVLQRHVEVRGDLRLAGDLQQQPVGDRGRERVVQADPPQPVDLAQPVEQRLEAGLRSRSVP